MVAEAFPLLYDRFPNYYELLGVPRNASKRDVISAYKKTALREHPDKAGGTALQNELFAAINNAKSVLIDEGLRKTYDYKLSEHLRPKPPPAPVKEPPKRSGGYSFPDFSRPFAQFGQPFRGTKSDFKPFGAGTGFGPERNGADADTFNSNNAWSGAQASGSTDHTSKSSRSKNHSIGCPICGSQFCAGSRYASQDDISDIPCSDKDKKCCPICGSPFCVGSRYAQEDTSDIPCPSKDKRSFFSDRRPHTGNSRYPDARSPTNSSGNQNNKKPFDPPFSRSASDGASGYFKAKGPASPQCTGDPHRCPEHHSADSHETRWKEPFPFEGDPGYVDPKRVIPFQYFIPPASTYDRYNHRGTKPNTSAWLQARWKCLSLPDEHQSTTNVAMHICDIAIEIDSLIERITQYCDRIEWFLSGEAHSRLVAAFDLLREVLHFAAGSYRYSSSLIDSSIYNRPDVAVPRLVTIRKDLTAIQRIMTRTRILLDTLLATIMAQQADMALWTIGEGIRSMIVVWDQVVLLPGNITQGCQDVFFSREGHFEDVFDRKSKIAGASYPNKPFMYKKPEGPGLEGERDTWTVDDEVPTLQKWEMGQRTREALRKREEENMEANANWGNWFNAEGDGESGSENDVDMSG